MAALAVPAPTMRARASGIRFMEATSCWKTNDAAATSVPPGIKPRLIQLWGGRREVAAGVALPSRRMVVPRHAASRRMGRARPWRSGPSTKLWDPGERIDQALAVEQRERPNRRSNVCRGHNEKSWRVGPPLSALGHRTGAWGAAGRKRTSFKVCSRRASATLANRSVSPGGGITGSLPRQAPAVP